jgi:hypothetical protein
LTTQSNEEYKMIRRILASIVAALEAQSSAYDPNTYKTSRLITILLPAREMLTHEVRRRKICASYNCDNMTKTNCWMKTEKYGSVLAHGSDSWFGELDTAMFGESSYTSLRLLVDDKIQDICEIS